MYLKAAILIYRSLPPLGRYNSQLVLELICNIQLEEYNIQPFLLNYIIFLIKKFVLKIT